MINSKIDFTCPNCNSKKYIGKTSIGKKYTEEPYVNVTSEIQCAVCFMDIPSNISENISSQDQKKISKVWFGIYKPTHKKIAAQCSKCFRYYWEIEKNLFEKKISTKDIFYQNYNPKKSIGALICKICDPQSFESN